MSIYFILPSNDRATITSARDIWLCNWYMYRTSKKMYCMLFLCIQQINECEPPILGHGSSIVGDTATMAWLDLCMMFWFVTSFCLWSVWSLPCLHVFVAFYVCAMRKGYMRAYTQMMPRTHTHKAVTGHSSCQSRWYNKCSQTRENLAIWSKALIVLYLTDIVFHFALCSQVQSVDIVAFNKI